MTSREEHLMTWITGAVIIASLIIAALIVLFVNFTGAKKIENSTYYLRSGHAAGGISEGNFVRLTSSTARRTGCR
jgi:hypothetical protein